MDEVDRLAIDRGAEVRELVQPRLLRSPVERVAPVLHQLAHVVHWDPVLPAGAVDLIGPARAGEAVLEVAQGGVLDGDLERLDRLGVGFRGRWLLIRLFLRVAPTDRANRNDNQCHANGVAEEGRQSSHAAHGSPPLGRAL